MQLQRLGLQLEAQPFGDVILDQEGRLADGGPLGVRIGGDAPRAGRGAVEQRQRQRVAAEARVGQGGASALDAVGPGDHEGQRQARHGAAGGVAQQGGEEHGLARPVDAALGIDEGVESLRRHAALDAPVG